MLFPNHRRLAVSVVTLALLVAPVATCAAVAPAEAQENQSGSSIELMPVNIPADYFEPGISTAPLTIGQGSDGTPNLSAPANANSAVIELSSPLTVAGISWISPADAPEIVWYRLLEDESWGTWHEIRTEANLGGTEPILLPNVSAAEIVVPQPEVKGVSLAVIDPEDYPDHSAGVQPAIPGNGEREAFQREDWLNGAAAGVNSATPLTVSGVVIHDVEGSSDYQPDQVPALLRAIHVYQSDVLGWGDIGYHSIVDKFGNTWEGIAGSYETPQPGGFSRSNGNQALDVAVLEDFTASQPTEAQMESLTEVTAAAFQLGGADVQRQLTATESNIAKSFDAISGYRDISATLSPGAGLYSRLGDLETAVTEALAVDIAAPAAENKEEAPAAAQTLAAPAPQALPQSPVVTHSARKWAPKVKIGHGWSGKVIFPGDWNRDGYPDIMRIDSKGDLYLYAGRSNQRFASPVRIGTKWHTMTWIQSGIDWDGDGNNDIIARKPSGDLYLYRGNGKGGFAGSVKIGHGWNGLTNLTVATTSAGTAIYAVNTAGKLLRYPANGRGGFKPKVTYGPGWNSMNHLVGVGNWNDDGYPDFLARRNNGDLLLYPGRANGGIGSAIKIGSGWGTMQWIGASNQRSRSQPLWVVDESGGLWSYKFDGKGVGSVAPPPAPKLPPKVSLSGGVYSFGMSHAAQQTNYWCGPATVYMVLQRLGYTRSTTGLGLSQANLASNAYLQTNRYGKTSWALNNLVTGVSAWTGNKVKYTRQGAPSAAQLRTRISDSVTKTGRPIILDAQEYAGGSHYNNHPVYSEFSHLMPVQSYNPGTDTMTVLDPASHFYAASRNVFSHKVGTFAPYLRAYGLYY